MAEWQPIESAPQDGSEIILFGLYPENDQGLPTLRVTAGWWLQPEPPIVGDCGGECRCPEYGEPDEAHWASMHGGSPEGWMSTDGGFTEEWPATHWMPLPAPPQGIEAGTGETARLDGEAMKARSAQADAPDKPDARDWQNRAERAEAECNELREGITEHRAALLVTRACLQIAKGQFDDPGAFKALNHAIEQAGIALQRGI